MEFLIPGLIAGVPILAIVLVVLLQLAGGAAWLPFVRRWRDKQQITASGRQPPA
jgi:hypothetical protein